MPYNRIEVLDKVNDPHVWDAWLAERPDQVFNMNDTRGCVYAEFVKGVSGAASAAVGYVSAGLYFADGSYGDILADDWVGRYVKQTLTRRNEWGMVTGTVAREVL
ncbi:hypothetical protein, partial [Nitrolancea hollandica]|uniref:hypothetical protein n=1 Tax=Nitrolancea hollandica TaxID=1206749 RepID=UPI0005908F09